MKLREFYEAQSDAPVELSVEALEQQVDEELLFAALESISEQEDGIYAQLEQLDALAEDVALTKDPVVSAEKFNVNADLIPSLEARTTQMAGGYIKRFWDDWFATRHRLIQGLVDLARDRQKTIKAYRKKLEAKNEIILDVLHKKGVSHHEASFVSIEKYWVYADRRSYPKDPMKAVVVDFDATVDLLNSIPKNALQALGTLEGVIKKADFSSIDRFQSTVEKDAERSLKPLSEVVGEKYLNKKELFLNGTFLVVYAKDKKDPLAATKTDYDSLTTPAKLEVISVFSSQDAFNALLLLGKTMGPFKWIADVATIVRAVTTQGFMISTSELKSMHDYGVRYLDEAEKAISRQIDSLRAISKAEDKIAEAMKNKEVGDGVSGRAEGLTRYASNISNLLGKPYSNLIRHNLKMAKGINYLLMRTVKRGR